MNESAARAVARNDSQRMIALPRISTFGKRVSSATRTAVIRRRCSHPNPTELVSSIYARAMRTSPKVARSSPICSSKAPAANAIGDRRSRLQRRHARWKGSGPAHAPARSSSSVPIGTAPAKMHASVCVMKASPAHAGDWRNCATTSPRPTSVVASRAMARAARDVAMPRPRWKLRRSGTHAAVLQAMRPRARTEITWMPMMARDDRSRSFASAAARTAMRACCSGSRSSTFARSKRSGCGAARVIAGMASRAVCSRKNSAGAHRHR